MQIIKVSPFPFLKKLLTVSLPFDGGGWGGGGKEFMLIINKPIKKTELRELAQKSFSEMIKFVVDVERELIAMDAEMHADLEQFLLEKGSKQENLWGGNYFPKENRIEYTSLINIRPTQNNRKLEIEDGAIKTKIEEIIKKYIL